MRRIRATLETIHLAALGVWVGGLIMTGAAAAIVFPTIRALNPELPDFSLYSDRHWAIAAGAAMERVFAACDILQAICAVTAALTLIAALAIGALSARRTTTMLRGFFLAAACVTLAYSALFLTPRMTNHMDSFRNAAREGRTADADEHRAAFDAFHPQASALLKATTLLAAAAFITGLWAAAGGDPARRGARP